MTDILILDATGQLQALAAGRIGARDLFEATLARCERLNPNLNAVVARAVDAARAAADHVDERRAKGETLGPLAGLPMTVKDMLNVEGLPASAGMAQMLKRPSEDAQVVARVRAAGAVVWGQTNSPVKAADWQTFNALYGTTNNPWDLARTCGGSSGGSAAALAAGLTALEIGADIAGSLRIPASFCGVFSHKPTFGIVSQRGLVPPRASEIDLGVVGPMARSARDLRLLLSLIADVPLPATAPPADLKTLKIALWLDDAAFPVDAPVRDAVVAFAKRLAAAGALVEPVRAPVDTEVLMRTYSTLLFSILGADTPPLQRMVLELFRPLAKLARGAGAMSAPHALLSLTARHSEWLAASETRAQLGITMAQFFGRYDVLLAPVAPVPAFAHDHSPFLLRKLTLGDGRRIGYREMMKWIALATVLGLPATAVPAGLTGTGLPVGVQIIGPHGGDARTLAVAQAIDEQIGGFVAPPGFDSGG